MTGVVTDSCGDTLEQYEARFASPLRNAEAARGEIGRCIAELRQLLGDKWQLMRGVGFAAPAEGETRDIVDRLADECGVPAGAWPAQTVKTGMEYIARLPNAPESLFHLHVGDGIGGGFIKEGKIFTGSSGGGIGIGHIVVDRDGPPCSCGGRGCLEAVAGRAGILEMVRAELRRGADTELREDNFSIRRFAECSHRDETARKIAVKAAESIGLALAAVATLLDPAVIVLSGELTGVGDPLLETVRGTLERNCTMGTLRKLKLELSTLETGDTARGAAMMIRDRIWGIDEWPYGENLKTDTIK